MKYEIRDSDFLEDWRVLACEGRDVGTAQVEGTLEEWTAIAHAIKRREGCGFRRCRVRVNQVKQIREHLRFGFDSPRNSLEVEVWLELEEAEALADSILAQAGAGAGI